MKYRRIGLIGHRDETVVAHRAIPRALALAADAMAARIDVEWVPTDEIKDSARIAGFAGLWCVPASPYRSTQGALRAIRFAREQMRPFLGTCGGFQHVIVEFERSVLGWSDADHAETNPDARLQVIAPLACPLVEATETIRVSA